MKHYPKILTMAVTLTGLLLFSCTKNSTNDLHEVQLCLNKADASTAMGCVDKISDDTSPIAYSLRCSAIFITQGFGSAASFVDALDNLKSGSGSCTGGCSPTISALTSLKFTAAGVATVAERDANNASAAEAFRQCSQSDAKIYTEIASLFQLGTLTSMEAYNLGSGSITEDTVKNALTNGTIDASLVGTIVTITYANSCQNTDNASDSTKDYCTQLKSAIDGGATTIEIGQCLIEKLKDPNYSGPLCTP